jgi:S-methylmethionine-dependent homocysteine/selenocysteine methylase/SAM-dependent methyltransferase
MSPGSSERYRRIQDAIAQQRCVILDGGVATELPHRHGQDHERLWGIEALASELDEVRGVHRRYAEAGADVITTNTWALPALMHGDGELEGDQHRDVDWMETARRGVRVAREAIAEAGRADECVVAFSLNGDIDGVGGADGAESVALLGRTLTSDPPDLILLETLSVVPPSLFGVVEALVDLQIPVWLSFRRCLHGLCGVYGQHWGGPEGDAFGRAAHRFEELGVAALLANCIPPDHVDGIVSYLRDFTDLPLGVYPNLGYFTSGGWRFETEIGGAEYGDLVRRWRAEGAQIVGGCCGTGPEHVAAARAALIDTRPGRERRKPRRESPRERDSEAQAQGQPQRQPQARWRGRRGRELHPLAFPALAKHPGVDAAVPGSYLLWRYLLEETIGAHQRCLDIGSGAGLHTVQLALNGAAHVHAIDIDERAVANTLDNAFRNGVDARVTAEAADLYPWLPQERYELIVASLPQIPIDPVLQLSSHRPADYWGRGLVDQVLAKLPEALASEGRALITLTSLLSRERTDELLAGLGLDAEVVAWEVHETGDWALPNREHLEAVQRASDGYTLTIGEQQLMVTYLLEIGLAATAHESPLRSLSSSL